MTHQTRYTAARYIEIKPLIDQTPEGIQLKINLAYWLIILLAIGYLLIIHKLMSLPDIENYQRVAATVLLTAFIIGCYSGFKGFTKSTREKLTIIKSITLREHKWCCEAEQKARELFPQFLAQKISCHASVGDGLTLNDVNDYDLMAYSDSHGMISLKKVLAESRLSHGYLPKCQFNTPELDFMDKIKTIPPM